MRKTPRLNTEDGYMAIIASLGILVLLTIVSISISRVASNEISMAGNETVYQRNFYLAEGAMMEAVDRLDNNLDIRGNTIDWMDKAAKSLRIDTVETYWDNTDTNSQIVPTSSDVDPAHTVYVAGVEGVAPGYSLDMEKSRIHAFEIYGRCVWNGTAIIKVGYLAPY
jgi:Tfp pilus assembly protein PilX